MKRNAEHVTYLLAILGRAWPVFQDHLVVGQHVL